MKYLKTFESLGINRDLEDQVRDYYKKINKEVNTKKFNLLYHHMPTNGKIYFELIIDDNILRDSQTGLFNYEYDKGGIMTGSYKITLKDRTDFSTFLHEVKHLDYLISNHLKSDSRDIIWGALTSLEDKGVNRGNIYEIFYLMSRDEFEAKYHGYYVGIDEYLSEYFEKNPHIIPTTADVVKLMNVYLKNFSPDKSYTWWCGDRKEIHLRNFATEKELLNIIDFILNGENKMDNVYFSNSFKDFVKRSKRFILGLFGQHTQVDKNNIEKYIEKLEKIINSRRPIYKKKFHRLYSIMVDKFVNDKKNN